MSSLEYEFDEVQNVHYSRLGKKAVIASVALIAFFLANLIHLWNTPISNIALRTASILLTISSLYTAVGLQRASASFFRIVNTQGNDISLLQSSNKRLQQAFTGLAATMAILSIRFILFIQS